MFTLVLRLAGPLQSWGTDSKFEIRRTEAMPTKSGVIGMLASALGRKRNESIDDLKRLRMSVRIEKPGEEIADFHTAKRKGAKDPYITTRYYLSDAEFLVGLESESHKVLQQLDEALRFPARPLYLGRRSCPLSLPLVLGIYPGTAVDVLASWPVQSKKDTVSILCEGRYGDEIRVMIDEPDSYDFHNRQHSQRKISTLNFSVDKQSEEEIENADIFQTDLDPMEALMEGD